MPSFQRTIQNSQSFEQRCPACRLFKRASPLLLSACSPVTTTAALLPSACSALPKGNSKSECVCICVKDVEKNCSELSATQLQSFVLKSQSYCYLLTSLKCLAITVFSAHCSTCVIYWTCNSFFFSEDHQWCKYLSYGSKTSYTGQISYLQTMMMVKLVCIELELLFFPLNGYLNNKWNGLYSYTVCLYI